MTVAPVHKIRTSSLLKSTTAATHFLASCSSISSRAAWLTAVFGRRRRRVSKTGVLGTVSLPWLSGFLQLWSSEVPAATHLQLWKQPFIQHFIYAKTFLTVQTVKEIWAAACTRASRRRKRNWLGYARKRNDDNIAKKTLQACSWSTAKNTRFAAYTPLRATDHKSSSTMHQHTHSDLRALSIAGDKTHVL